MNEYQPSQNRKLNRAYRGARAFMAKTPVTLLVWHLLIIAIGLISLVAGVVMLVVPGPGALFIVLGIFVLSTEYTWAKRAMGPIRSMIETASSWWQDPALRRIRRQVIGSFVLLIALLGGWYFLQYGTTLDGFRDLEELLTR